MKFLIVIVGLFAIGNATNLVRFADPAVIPTVVSPIVSPFVRSVIPAAIPATDISEWDAYKTKFGKSYVGIEDRFRRNIYFATKEKLAKYDELIRFGIGSEKLELDIFADYTRDELFSLRSILEESQDEWNEYKLKYGKVYDSFEDRFRKTVYFIVKDMISAHNKLAELGFVSYKFPISFYTDYFHDELPLGTHLWPTTGIVPATRFLSTYPYSYPLSRSIYPYVF